ncbi:MAG: hypothetical protein KGZ96_03575 [Clostridia bacterium]|nr:hypothetical protein [Clostridia bacterium]
MISIAICLKIVPGINLSQTFEPVNTKVDAGYPAFELVESCQQGISLALAIKERTGARITGVTVAHPESVDCLEQLNSMGVDQSVRIWGEGMEDSGGLVVSRLLSKYFQAYPQQLVICGRHSGPGGSGQVGPYLAELMKLSHIAGVVDCHVDLGKSSILIERNINDEWVEMLGVSFPVLLTVSPNKYELPYAPLPAYVNAQKRHITEIDLTCQDIEWLMAADKRKIKYVKSRPASPSPQEIFTPNSPEPVERIRQMSTSGLQHKSSKLITGPVENQVDDLIDYFREKGWLAGGNYE